MRNYNHSKMVMMMTEDIKPNRALDQLGLPPMELAESANERSSRCLYRCMYPALQKVFILLVLLTFSAGLYILLLKLLGSSENTHNTEIILVTGLQETRNITVHQNDWEIFFQLKNHTDTNIKRRKRNVLNPIERHKGILERLRGDDLDKVRRIILKHRALCHDEKHRDKCTELIKSLKSILERNEAIPLQDSHFLNTKDIKKDIDHTNALPTEVIKRETQLPAPGVSLDGHLPHVMSNFHPLAAPHLTDTCLLAKLLKQSCPHNHEIYNPTSPETIASQFDQPHVPHMRYFQPSIPSYVQNREIETHKRKLHPQDIDILRSFLYKNENLPKQDTKKSSRAMECPLGSLSCDNSEDCIEEKQWCDGNVECSDASDESKCSCKSRVDKSRLCDGYFDCPFGEDEMGCNDCSENTFSCDNLGKESTCFTKEQRCNGINDCTNGKDEIECNMLSPSLHNKPLFAISNTEGYLHRNFKGDWYAVCQNPYMWAHDACRRETGLIIRPPIIQLVPIDPISKVTYLNTGPGGFIDTSETCFNSSAVYVTCPDFLCGTRVPTTSQLLRENTVAENQLFGRNKRFLYPNHPFDPYHMIYYGNRIKRDTAAITSEESIEDSDSKSDIISNEERNKRAEGRVVGGKPSQPAAWPWMVAVYRNGMFHCGGVILTQSWVISAAHCVHKFWDHYYEIQVGMLRRFSFSPQEQNLRVTHVIVNQHYNQIDMKDDLSLLKVEPAIQFSRWVRPICLPGPNTAGPDWLWGPAPGTVCTAIGWGATVEHGPDPDHMREVDIPIWERCKHREDRVGNEICAGFVDGGKDACQGDSGGPLLCRNPLNSQQWYLAGIVSHGDGCGRKDEPGVYTRVSLFVKWIKYHTSSKLLPVLQPLQECPGFKCESGISKCLPNIRKCDKIVDCLAAEDETNCDFMRSSNDGLFETVNTTKIEIEKKPIKTSREVDTTSFSSNEITSKDVTVTSILTDDTPTTEKGIDFTTTNLGMKFENNVKSDNDQSESKPSSSISEIPDFTQASTIEFSPTRSFEEFDTNEGENVTVDPTTVSYEEIIETTTPSDQQTLTVSFKQETLESRSSVLGKLRPEVTSNIVNFEVEEVVTVKGSDQPSTSQTNDLHFTSSTQKSRGDMTPDDQINTENDFDYTINTEKDMFVTEFDSSTTQSSNIENKSEKLITHFLPASNSSELNKTTKDNGKIKSDERSKNEITTESISAKNLPDIEDKSDVIQTIEDNSVFSELQPASIRRKHHVPKQFECRRIYQQIPFNQRCNRRADCEDGTDELGCTCTDYLSAFDDKLICDGVFDCADGQDEIDCYSCPEDHFLCKRSELCLPTKYVCDGNSQCPLGEDELNCFALSNGREMYYDIEEKPKINLEGFLTKRNKDDWQVVCENEVTIEQQEESAARICRYLGFSSANRYFIKYINVKEEDIVRSGFNEIKRTKRDAGEGVPIHFAFKDVSIDDETARNIIIKEPQVLKEECVPNVTKTCKSLYVFCDRYLYTNFDVSQDLLYTRAVETSIKEIKTHLWPWIAKLYVEGDYKCTGVLIDLTWVLVSDSCLWDSSLAHNFISVILGSHRTLNSLTGFYERVHKVDAKKDLYGSRVTLLHLKEPAEYSNLVKPMIISPPSFYNDQKTVCVAIGQDNNNNTLNVFMNETNKHCNPSNRCFVRAGNESICPTGMKTQRPWSGLISCHNERGWYPAATFVESRGECGLGDRIVATDIENLRQEVKYYSGKVPMSDSIEHTSSSVCDGVRCSRGKCVSLRHICDGVRNCEDGNDETEESCMIKRNVCAKDPYGKGCECLQDQMKCKNGKCISKELFRDGKDDCGDGTDEPLKSSCSDYLARVMPSRLCDGVLHCHDRSDEDPMYCKCFAKRIFKCDKSSESNHCVAPDMVCDGVRDCPNGEDERTCIGLSAPEGTPYGTGQVIVRAHGVWHSKCYPTRNHTKSELEAICRELGFISGHAKEIKDDKYLVNSHNNLLLEPYNDIVLNNQTILKMRNTNAPIATAVFDESLKNCFPVFIECL